MAGQSRPVPVTSRCGRRHAVVCLASRVLVVFSSRMTAEQILVLPTDDPATRAACARLHAAALAGPGVPARPDVGGTADLDARLLLTPPYLGGVSLHGAVDRDGSLVGCARLAWRDDVAHLSVAVRPDARGRGTGGRLVARAQAYAACRGLRGLVTEAPRQDPAASRIARRHGMVAVGHEVRSQLALGTAPTPPGQSWPGDPRYHVVRWHDRCPSGLLAGYARLVAALHPHEPLIPAAEVRYQEYTRVRAGLRGYAVGVVERHGARLVAVSTLHAAGSGRVAVQAETVVSPARRGQGIGRLVKRELLRSARRAEPALEVVETSNDAGNTGILTLNARLGFVPVGEQVVWSCAL
jgi:GNAT superfamily N-acetyltransferase